MADTPSLDGGDANNAQAAYPFPVRAWWKEASVYQIYPASFNDSNGDGLGDLPGIIQKIDYLEELGVDVVWLCPVCESPQADMGYDISNYRAIHPPYGTVSDVEDLLSALHQRGMKLLMDLVVNHTSDQHEWFKESRQSLTNGKRNWYIWRKPRFDEHGTRRPPNNWASIFGGSAWTFDEETGEYFLHLFAKGQPDLNWEEPAVVQEVHEIMKFWLDKGVDGFRMDVINLISKTPGLPDAPITLAHELFQPAYMHYANGPRLHEHFRELRRVLDRYDAFAVGEMPWVKDQQQVQKVVAAHRKELNMIFQFDIVDIDLGQDGKFSPNNWSLTDLKKIVGKWQSCLSTSDCWNTLFLENHDQSRSVSRFTRHRAEHRSIAATMLASFIGFQAGTLFVFQGQELGMANLPKSWPIAEYKDFETQNLYQLAQQRFKGDQPSLDIFLKEVQLKARDHARSPVQWNATKHAGFTTGTPWMSVNEDYALCNAEQQMSDPASVLAYWRRVLALRKDYQDLLIYGSFEMVDRDSPSVFCYRRSFKGSQAVVVCNFTDQLQEWTVPEGISACLATGAVVLANYWDESARVDNLIMLRPFEAFTVVREQGKLHL